MGNRLGFGCAPILGRVGRRQSLFALELAYDSGVTHFDVARSYGFGEAEALMAEFIKNKRESITITSKFGVVPPRQSAALSLLKGVARSIYAAAPVGREVVRKAAKAALAHHNYDSKYAAECLHHSLTQLRTDFIDHYLIHDPVSGDYLSDELRYFLDSAVRDGKIREWGVACDSRPILGSEFVRYGQVIQMEANLACLDSIDLPRAESARFFITRPYGGEPQRMIEAVVRPHIAQVVSTLDMGHFKPHELSMFFALSLAGSTGKVIVSMFTKAHLLENIALERSFVAAGERTGRLFSLLIAELRRREGAALMHGAV